MEGANSGGCKRLTKCASMGKCRLSTRILSKKTPIPSRRLLIRALAPRVAKPRSEPDMSAPAAAAAAGGGAVGEAGEGEKAPTKQVTERKLVKVQGAPKSARGWKHTQKM